LFKKQGNSMLMAMDANTNQSEMTVHERRRSERFKVNKDVFITFRPDFDRIGKVTDINKGGLGFEYVSFDRVDKLEHVEVDIFSKSNNLYISRIACNVVYDISKGPFFILNSTETRRCGLQFGQLSKDHLGSLSALLKDLR
jgi:hypothetical protein